MRIFCMLMVILFISFAVLATINLIVEWNGKCDNCTFGEDPATGQPYVGHHPTQCGVLISSRFKSAFLTIILYMCSGTWAYLLWDAYRDLRESKFEKKFTEIQTNYLANMRNGYERHQPK